MHTKYVENSWGDFYAIGSRGQNYGLIGHDSGDVTEWLADHPDYTGSIYFNYADGSGEDVDVTEIFMREDA